MTATTEFRPLISPDSKMQPIKQLFNGYEIEKRFVLLTKEEDHTKRSNAPEFYDETLREGVEIDQGYIKDIQVAIKMLQELGIDLNEFQPNTIRLRKFGEGYKEKKISRTRYVLTLKDRKETKKREAEFKLSKAQFDKYWPSTQGSRIFKKRMKKKIKGFTFEVDAFTDRYLLIIECEVDTVEALNTVPKMGMDITNLKDWSNKALSR